MKEKEEEKNVVIDSDTVCLLKISRSNSSTGLEEKKRDRKNVGVIKERKRKKEEEPSTMMTSME